MKLKQLKNYAFNNVPLTNRYIVLHVKPYNVLT